MRKGRRVELWSFGRSGCCDLVEPAARSALAQPGCIHYDWSADLNDPARINVFEEWESEEALTAHFAGWQYAGMRAHLGASGLIKAASRKYRIDAEGPVYNDEGTPTPKFSV